MVEYKNTKENVVKLLKAMRDTRMENLKHTENKWYKTSLLMQIPFFDMVIDLLTDPYEFADYADNYSEIFEEEDQDNG